MTTDVIESQQPAPQQITIPELINISSILIAQYMMKEDWRAFESLTLGQQRMCQSVATLGLVETVNTQIKEVADAVSSAVVESLFKK